MEDMVLAVRGLRVCRGGATVVDDVSFTLAPGTDTALIGPNGAGKSSLLQALIGILPRRGGEVRLLGAPLGPRGQLPPAIREQIAYLPQTLTLGSRFPVSVREFVGLGWDRAGLSLPWTGGAPRRAAISAALARTDCADLADRSLSALSTGQLKRVLLAFCVVRPRRLLLLDEAQAGLDPLAAEAFHQLLDQLRRSEGWTVLQVSHDLEMVRRSSDRVLCLNRTLRCSGSPQHALSAQQLERVYGRGWVPYHHHHSAGPSGTAR